MTASYSADGWEWPHSPSSALGLPVICAIRGSASQIRDLRLLDAQPASSPPAILCRDQAIVVNLEFIKCIITTRASHTSSQSHHAALRCRGWIRILMRRTATMVTSVTVCKSL